MKAQSSINIETLIPSTLLEEEHSDNENISKIKFKDDIPIFEGAPKKNDLDEVIYFL